jgi:hypothetical protein
MLSGSRRARNVFQLGETGATAMASFTMFIQNQLSRHVFAKLEDACFTACLENSKESKQRLCIVFELSLFSVSR